MSTEVELSSELLHILRHALGVGDDGRRAAYRNHFVTGQGSTDYPLCKELVARGLMTQRSGNELTGGCDLFVVTEAGRSAARPAPAPKLTRSQQRYRAWLDSDSSLRFGEWIRMRAPSAPQVGAHG